MNKKVFLKLELNKKHNLFNNLLFQFSHRKSRIFIHISLNQFPINRKLFNKDLSLYLIEIHIYPIKMKHHQNPAKKSIYFQIYSCRIKPINSNFDIVYTVN